MRVFKNKWFVRFAAREGIDDQRLCEAVQAAERGTIDADLGGGVIKQRVARPGEGKSGGYRTIIFYRKTDSAFFIYGFSKNERDNIAPQELKSFKRLAGSMLDMTKEEIEKQIKAGFLKRVKCNEK